MVNERKCTYMDDKVKKGCGIGCFGIIALFILLIMLGSCGDDEDKAFDFTVDEYEENLKQVVNKKKGNSFIAMQPKEAREGGYRINLMDSIIVSTNVDKNNLVTSASVISTLDAFMVYNKELRIAFESIIKSVDSTIGVTQMYMVFEKLGITGDSKMLDHIEIYTLNGIKYTYKGSTEENRIILKAEPN